MKKCLCFVCAVLLLALVPARSQQRKSTFTGTLECLGHIPAYQDGQNFYVNPYPGGQSGSLVVLREASGAWRVWDNAARMWVTESLEDCKCVFFINANMFFVGKDNDRCGVYFTSLLDGFKAEDKSMMFTDWRFHRNAQQQLDCLLLALGGKWGLMAPNGHFLVPTRYGSPEEAYAALAKRKEAEKPLGMSDMEFLSSEIHRLAYRRELGETVHVDWEWYDPVSGTLFYTLEELPWCGPYYRFTGVFDYEPEVLEEGARHALWDILVGVEDGVMSFIINPDSFSGPMLPLSSEVCGYLTYKPFPVKNAPGDLFYGYTPEGYGHEHKGIRINKDGSFQVGLFSAFDDFDGTVDVYRHDCIPGTWEYDDFFRHYVTSAHNKGEDPSEKEVLQAYREQLGHTYYNLYYDHFHIWNTYEQDKTLTVFLDPLLTVKVPVSKSLATAFCKEYEKYYDDPERFKVKVTRKVTDSGEVYVEYLYIVSAGGLELEYMDFEEKEQSAE